MPIESLKELKKHFDSIIYVSFFTVQPDRGVINEYVQQMTDELLDDKTQLWLTRVLDRKGLSEQITYNSIKELTEN
jgi:L-ribulose-5-phosphate 3-epimerase UlaE